MGEGRVGEVREWGGKKEWEGKGGICVIGFRGNGRH